MTYFYFKTITVKLRTKIIKDHIYEKKTYDKKRTKKWLFSLSFFT